MVSTATAQPPAGQSSGKYTFSLISLTFLFFIWGFITCLNDILVPHLKEVFDLTYVQASLVQFCFFGAYFIVSIPAGKIVQRTGYQGGIVTGLLIAACGCLAFYPAAKLQSYPMFLGALFILASGITLLQVAANPYVTILGSAKTAASRLTLTQAFNALGTTLAPLFGSILILGAVTASIGTDEYKLQQANSVQGPYLFLFATLVVLALVFSKLNLPQISTKAEDSSVETPTTEDTGSVWQYRHLLLGALAIFVYVGAEVSIGSYLVNFMKDSTVAGLSEIQAGHYLSLYWGGAMVGRFIGALVLHKIAARKVLAFNATVAASLLIASIFISGHFAMWTLLAIGLFNSIMFPTIFSLALTGLGKYTSRGSGILCAAIAGGAVVPVFQGLMADTIGLQLSFFVPVICYSYILFYALKGADAKTLNAQ